MPSYLKRQLLLSASLLAFISSAHADPLNAIYVFGDSLSDVGNAFIATAGATPAPPYFNGHFTNGQVWVEDLAASLGLPAVQASLASPTGTDFAVGGALAAGANPADLASQLTAFHAANAVANPNGLYTIWIGSNDLADILAANPGNAAAAAAAVAAVGSIDLAINTLAGEGAKNFLIVTVPDLGKAPGAIAAGPLAVAAASSLSAFFDDTLVNGLAKIPSLNAIAAADSLNLKVLDTYSLLDAISANPGQFGFSNVTDPCLVGAVNYAGGTPCANPNQYLFWDQMHPTAAGQAIVAADALQVVVPEPAMFTMLLGSVGILGIFAARRRAARIQ